MATAWQGAEFDPEGDHIPQIYQALNSADPAATIGDLWPWMRARHRKEAVDNFVALAIPLQNAGAGDDLELVVQRFDYAVVAYCGELPPPSHPWWRLPHRRKH